MIINFSLDRKVPTNSYTGKGLDRPGPTDYQPVD